MPKHTPIRKGQTNVGIDDIRSYFGSESGSWSLGGSGGYQNTRELAGKMTGPVDIAAVRGVAHTNWAGLAQNEINGPGSGVWDDIYPSNPPDPGNWRRGRSGWPNNDIQGSSITSNFGTIDIYHEKENIAVPTSIGIKGYFKATVGQTYNYIIQWYCVESQGHDFAAQGKQPQTVYAGFASTTNGYQDGTQTVYPFHEEIGVEPKFNNNTRTWTGSLTAQSVHMIPYIRIFMDSIVINQGRTCTIGVLQHRIWEA